MIGAVLEKTIRLYYIFMVRFSSEGEDYSNYFEHLLLEKMRSWRDARELLISVHLDLSQIKIHELNLNWTRRNRVFREDLSNRASHTTICMSFSTVCGTQGHFYINQTRTNASRSTAAVRADRKPVSDGFDGARRIPSRHRSPLLRLRAHAQQRKQPGNLEMSASLTR